ncbi:DMT family transporter [Metabacillus herbersteinensis]|uniref:DMT family transporter n=1 Tax=Metabacillus herbersteinensis TaxID=283816 RepID=A0ABV6GDP0_9BACI
MKKGMFADSALLFVAFIWGATFVIVQKAIAYMPPHLFNSVRFFIAAVCLISIAIFIKRKVLYKMYSIKLVIAGVILGSFLFLGYAFQTVGLLYTTSSKAGFITGLSVMIVPFLSLWVIKEKPKVVVFAGAFLGCIGLYYLTIGDVQGLNGGDMLIFLCAIFFALHIVFTGKYSGQNDALSLTIVQLLTVSVLSFFSFLLFEKSEISSFKRLIHQDVIVALIITSFFATALAFLIQTKFQQFTTSAKVALIFAMEPVFAALTAFIVIEEKLSTSGIIGCLFIFTAMIVSEIPDKWLNKSLKSV